MITVVDRAGDVVVQKVTKPDGTVLRYQYGKPGDFQLMAFAPTLEEARTAIGKGRQHVSG